MDMRFLSGRAPRLIGTIGEPSRELSSGDPRDGCIVTLPLSPQCGGPRHEVVFRPMWKMEAQLRFGHTRTSVVSLVSALMAHLYATARLASIGNASPAVLTCPASFSPTSRISSPRVLGAMLAKWPANGEPVP